MKCKKCGSDLRVTDTICLNCGSLVSNSVNDLYDDINTDEEDDLSDLDNDSAYNKELDELLNSYHTDDNSSGEIPDYSNFDSFRDDNIDDAYDEDSVILNEDNNNDFLNGRVDENITIGSDGLDDYTIDNLIDFVDTGNSYNYEKNSQKESKKLNISIVPFKVVFAIALVVLLVILGVFGYRYFSSKKSEKVDYEINKEDTNVTSKYSLTSNPNYIKDHTWVCGTIVDGKLTTDRTSYFQYDFNKDGSYARQFLNRPDTYEDGKYGVSLEDVSNDRYLYKLYMIANLDGGYKTKYTFTLNVNKDGTTAIYKYNSTEFACEEMNFYNSKFQ